MKAATRAARRLTFRRRTLLAGWLLAAGVVVWRAGQIQIAEGATWRAQAESQHRMSAEVVAARGSVVDRNRRAFHRRRLLQTLRRRPQLPGRHLRQ